MQSAACNTLSAHNQSTSRVQLTQSDDDSCPLKWEANEGVEVGSLKFNAVDFINRRAKDVPENKLQWSFILST